VSDVNKRIEINSYYCIVITMFINNVLMEFVFNVQKKKIIFVDLYYYVICKIHMIFCQPPPPPPDYDPLDYYYDPY
jgi:hypothetical protein